MDSFHPLRMTWDNRLTRLLSSLNQTSSDLSRSDEVYYLALHLGDTSGDSPDSVSDFSVVLLRSGTHTGKIAVIAEVVDHNRVSRGRTSMGGPFSSLYNRLLSTDLPRVSPAMFAPIGI